MKMRVVPALAFLAVLAVGRPATAAEQPGEDTRPADVKAVPGADAGAGAAQEAPAAGGVWDGLRRAGQAIKNEAERQAVNEVINNPQPYARAALQGLSQEDNVRRRVRQMYNAAPEGSEDRKKLNDLFVQVQGAKTPEERAAAEREVEGWGEKYPPLPSSEPVVPTRTELEAARDQAERNVQEQDENIKEFTRMGDATGVRLAEWVRDQDQRRVDEANQRLQAGEFREEEGQGAAAATTAASAGGLSQGSTLSATATTPATSGGPEAKEPESAPAEEPRSASGYTRDQLESDNWNLRSSAERTERRIKDLEQQIKDSRNSTERRELQNELSNQRAELAGIDQRIADNETELFAMGDEPRKEGEEPPKHDPQVLQNDNWNMQNLAERTQREIKDLQQQIKDSRNSTERRDLQEQIDRKKDELAALQRRVDDNNLELMDMGEKLGTGPGPNLSAQDLQNDNWNMGNLADRTRDQIKDLEQQIRDCRNSTERRELQDQLNRKKDELAGLQNRINGNNEQLLDMGERPGTGPGPSWSRNNLENDNWNMGNMAERLEGEIMDLEQQIAESHDGSERQRLRDELNRKKNELEGVQERIEENNQALENMPPGEGDAEASDAAEEVFDSGSDEGTGGEGEGEGSESADESSEGEGDMDALRTDEGGSWDESSVGDGDGDESRPLDEYVDDYEAGQTGDEDYALIEGNTEVAGASVAGDEDVEEADQAVNLAGAEAQGIGEDSSATVAAADAVDSWGHTIGTAVIEGTGDGFEQGGQALGEHGAAVVTEHVFSDDGHAEGEDEAESEQVADADDHSDEDRDEDRDDDEGEVGHPTGGPDHEDRGGHGGGGTGHGTPTSATSPGSTTPATPQLVRCPKCGRMVPYLVWCPACNMDHCPPAHQGGGISFDEETLKKQWESTHNVDQPVSEPNFTP